MRILKVAAFAVSGYASSEGRHCKPFNPLLGETYEADYPEKGVRFFSEKVIASNFSSFITISLFASIIIFHITAFLRTAVDFYTYLRFPEVKSKLVQ